MSTRRRFLKQANCAAVGTASIASSLFSLKMTAAAASGTPLSGYKALVCLFFSGGNDSFNMLAPKDPTAYAEYTAVRGGLGSGGLALDSSTELLSISSADQAYTDFGIHHHLPYLQSLYNSGNLAFVSNIGTLIEPTTLAQFDAETVQTPVGLFSHADEQVHWQTLVPQVRGAGPKGWAGRMADCMAQANLSGSVGMNISLAGNNVLQVGSSSIPYITDPAGAVRLKEYTDPTFAAAADAILGENYKSIYHKTLTSSNRRAIDTAVAFGGAIDIINDENTAPTVTEDFKNGINDSGDPTQTKLDKQLHMVAKTLAARNLLSMDRQVFFVERGGWDHHNEVLQSQEDLFKEVNDAIESFWTELGHLGLQDDVVLFTASDFGRTLTSNGAGSDHAWGGNAFMIGGNVAGGKIYGQYPILSTGGPTVIPDGRGRLIPTTSVDAYVAELASWFGASSAEIPTIAPNALNFFDPATTPYPLGILG